MRRVALLIVATLALLAATAPSVGAEPTRATLRISGNGPLTIAGDGWRFKERVVVNVNVAGKVWRRVVLANTRGYWRFQVITIPIGCDRIGVTAKGPKTGTLSARRMFGACPEVGPVS